MSEHSDFLLRLPRCGVRPSDLKIVTGLYDALEGMLSGLAAAKNYARGAKISGFETVFVDRVDAAGSALKSARGEQP